jgi:hypothetical protein
MNSVVGQFAKTSTTKGTKVHEEKAVEFKTFVALCVLRGSGFLGAHRQSEPRPMILLFPGDFIHLQK